MFVNGFTQVTESRRNDRPNSTFAPGRNAAPSARRANPGLIDVIPSGYFSLSVHTEYAKRYVMKSPGLPRHGTRSVMWRGYPGRWCHVLHRANLRTMILIPAIDLFLRHVGSRGERLRRRGWRTFAAPRWRRVAERDVCVQVEFGDGGGMCVVEALLNSPDSTLASSRQPAAHGVAMGFNLLPLRGGETERFLCPNGAEDGSPLQRYGRRVGDARVNRYYRTAIR